MRYYPKNAVGFELDAIDVGLLESVDDDCDCKPWGRYVLEALDTWDGNECFDDELFNEFEGEHGVTPMRIGSLQDERGGEVSGVRGFELGINYLFFDPEEQDEDDWAKFESFLDDQGIQIVKGSWSQLG